MLFLSICPKINHSLSTESVLSGGKSAGWGDDFAVDWERAALFFGPTFHTISGLIFVRVKIKLESIDVDRYIDDPISIEVRSTYFFIFCPNQF